MYAMSLIVIILRLLIVLIVDSCFAYLISSKNIIFI
jgi:hypothetical protein